MNKYLILSLTLLLSTQMTFSMEDDDNNNSEKSSYCEVDPSGQTELMKAIPFIGQGDKIGQANAMREVARCLESGARESLDIQDSQGMTALIRAVVRQHPGIIGLLINAGANLELRTTDKQTALTLSLFRDDLALLLINAGADLGVFTETYKDMDYRKTPYERASEVIKMIADDYGRSKKKSLSQEKNNIED